MIGFWQVTDRSNILNAASSPYINLGGGITGCLIGFIYGDGNALGNSSVERKFGSGFVYGNHMANLLIRQPNRILVEQIRTSMTEFFDGNTYNQQMLDLMPLFGGLPTLQINSANPALTKTNQYSLAAVNSFSLTVEEFEVDQNSNTGSVPWNTTLLERVGIYCKHLASANRLKILFNTQNDMSSANFFEGTQPLANVSGTAILTNFGANSTSACPATEIRGSWFRNVDKAFVAQNCLYNTLNARCNYFQNVRTGFDLSNNVTMINDFCDASAPCGNKFTWNLNFFGIASIPLNDCKVLRKQPPLIEYYSYRNERDSILIPYGMMYVNNNTIQVGIAGTTCSLAVRDPFARIISKPTDISPDPRQLGYFNLYGKKVADINANFNDLPIGVLLKIDETGKQLIKR